MAKVNFNLRDANSKTETRINCVIRYNNLKLVYPTGITINPKSWNSEKQEIKNNTDKEIQLTNLRTAVLTVFNRFKTENKRNPSIEELRDALNIETGRTQSAVKLDLFAYITQFRENSKSKVNKYTGRTLASKTFTSYKQLNELLIEFRNTKKYKVSFDTINHDFDTAFKLFLTKDKEFSVNTIGKHIQTLKVILNDAVKNKQTTNIDFRDFAVYKQETDSIYLTISELELIQKLDLSNNLKLGNVRDLFLIGCYTGLRFSDFTNINAENIDGDFLTIETKKTGKTVSVPIHKAIKPIFQKCMERYSRPTPPPISNQKMNEYIKEVCKKVDSFHSFVRIKENKAGLTYYTKYQKFELITTHTARRSFATNNFISGLNSQVIMAITGHKSEKSFLAYLKLKEKENAEIMRLHWEEKSNLKIG